MTTSHRSVALAAALLGGLLAVAVSPAAAEHHEAAHAEPAHPDDAARVIEVVSTNVQGKNVYIPSTFVVVEGKPHALSIFNTTEVPHGFAIAAAGVEAVLQPQQETRVELPALQDGIYRVHCQLHPAHRSAQLLVIDDD